jgi:hypothetical protein
METPERDEPSPDTQDQDAEPTKTAEMIEQEPERDQAEGQDG